MFEKVCNWTNLVFTDSLMILLVLIVVSQRATKKSNLWHCMLQREKKIIHNYRGDSLHKINEDLALKLHICTFIYRFNYLLLSSIHS